jgi:hypothetical protein
MGGEEGAVFSIYHYLAGMKIGASKLYVYMPGWWWGGGGDAQ